MAKLENPMKASFWLRLHRVFELRHRRVQLSRVGTPLVRQWAVDLCGDGLLDSQLPGGNSFGCQSVQLDRLAPQGLDQLRYAHAVCPGVRGAVHDGRAN